jgi:dipeptide/tripeptide permease
MNWLRGGISLTSAAFVAYYAGKNLRKSLIPLIISILAIIVFLISIIIKDWGSYFGVLFIGIGIALAAMFLKKWVLIKLEQKEQKEREERYAPIKLLKKLRIDSDTQWEQKAYEAYKEQEKREAIKSQKARQAYKLL